ncbi:putative sphingosine kinase [Peziza echinospora]|nr:putative sphingosine kinase [Peziza echinospora]
MVMVVEDGESSPSSRLLAADAAAEAHHHHHDSSKLNLSSTLSLEVIGASLIVTDGRRSKKQARESCVSALCGTSAPATLEIRLYNLLFAEVLEGKLAITYAEHTSKTAVRPVTREYPVGEAVDRVVLKGWVEKVMVKAYSDAIPKQRIKVLLNPHGGRGTANKLWQAECEPLFRAARCTFDVESTTHHKHAIEIAEHLDIAKYDTVACVSGDGLPHEVFNGLGRRSDAATALRKIAVCQLPGGSGNGMCWSLTGTDSASLASLAYIKGRRTPIDLASVTSGEQRILSVLSQSYGIIAESDLGTDHLRWMGGQRFTWGILSRIFSKTAYPCDLALKVEIEDKAEIREYVRRGGDGGDDLRDASISISTEAPGDGGGGLPKLKHGTVNDELPVGWELIPYRTLGNFWAGNMTRMSADAIFFPAALPCEGQQDLVTVDANTPRATALKMMIACETGSHFDLNCLTYRKVSAYRLIPHSRKGGGYISIDGEPLEFGPFQVESHRGLGTTLSKDGRFTGMLV